MVDIPEADPDTPELCEVVYSAEMATTKPPTLTERMVEVEKALELFHKKTKIEWTRDNRIGLSISIGTVILVVIAYFAWWQPQWKAQADEDFARHVDDRIKKNLNDHVDPEMKDLGKGISDLGDRLTRIEGQLDILRPLMEEQIRKIMDRAQATGVVKPADIAYAAKQLREIKGTIPVEQIAQIAKSLLTGEVTQAKWDAAIQLANLRSFVNTTFAYAKQHVGSIVKAGPDDTYFPTVNADQWIEFTNASFKLDGKLGELGTFQNAKGQVPNVFRNLIIKDSVVEYRGGKITLINVFFEHCTFVISNNDNGHRFAESILNPAPYTSFAGD